MIFLWATLTILALYLAILVAATRLSTRPFRIPLFMSPGFLGSPQEEVQFVSGGLMLRGWWVPAESPQTVVVLSHGYAMNRSELAPVAHWLHERGIASLLYDFRAHGVSAGRRCTMGIEEVDDVLAAVDFVRTKAPGARIVLLGSSMGAVAGALAMARNPEIAQALVMDGAYSRLSNAVGGWWRFLGGRKLELILGPVVWLAKPIAGIDPFALDVAAALEKTGIIPVLFLHGDCDSLAPPSEAERNFLATPGPKRIVWFPQCGHAEGRWLQPDRYFDALEEFLEEHGLMDPVSVRPGNKWRFDPS